MRRLSQRRFGRQKTGKGGQQSVSNFQPVAKERRPELGSFLAELLTFVLSFVILGRGIAVRGRGGSLLEEWVYNIVGLLIGLYAIFGLPERYGSMESTKP
jgi:hypothetical protein